MTTIPMPMPSLVLNMIDTSEMTSVRRIVSSDAHQFEAPDLQPQFEFLMVRLSKTQIQFTITDCKTELFISTIWGTKVE